MHKCDTKIKEKKENKRLQVAHTHAHAYMSALVPQGSQ